MIRSYGLFWHRDIVHWGHQKDAGALWGSEGQNRRAPKVDFRDQRGIYALYFGYRLMYVGQTGSGNARLFKRLRSHLDDHVSGRWDRFSWFGISGVTKQNVLSADTKAIRKMGVRTALNILEAMAIAVAEPRLNLQRGRWGTGTQYFQREHDKDE
jgi:hypothetical protein